MYWCCVCNVEGHLPSKVTNLVRGSAVLWSRWQACPTGCLLQPPGRRRGRVHWTALPAKATIGGKPAHPRDGGQGPGCPRTCVAPIYMSVAGGCQDGLYGLYWMAFGIGFGRGTTTYGLAAPALNCHGISDMAFLTLMRFAPSWSAAVCTRYNHTLCAWWQAAGQTNGPAEPTLIGTP